MADDVEWHGVYGVCGVGSGKVLCPVSRIPFFGSACWPNYRELPLLKREFPGVPSINRRDFPSLGLCRYCLPFFWFARLHRGVRT